MRIRSNRPCSPDNVYLLRATKTICAVFVIIEKVQNMLADWTYQYKWGEAGGGKFCPFPWDLIPPHDPCPSPSLPPLAVSFLPHSPNSLPPFSPQYLPPSRLQIFSIYVCFFIYRPSQLKTTFNTTTSCTKGRFFQDALFFWAHTCLTQE